MHQESSAFQRHLRLSAKLPSWMAQYIVILQKTPRLNWRVSGMGPEEHTVHSLENFPCPFPEGNKAAGVFRLPLPHRAARNFPLVLGASHPRLFTPRQALGRWGRNRTMFAGHCNFVVLVKSHENDVPCSVTSCLYDAWFFAF